MTLLFLLVVITLGGPFLFRHIERRGIRQRSLWVGWRAAMELCVAVPVLIVVIGGRVPALGRVDVPLPLLVLLPISWGAWLVLRRQLDNRQGAS